MGGPLVGTPEYAVTVVDSPDVSSLAGSEQRSPGQGSKFMNLVANVTFLFLEVIILNYISRQRVFNA